MGSLVQARDVLAEMREIKAMLKRHRWVSVEDRLPDTFNEHGDTFNYVLAYDRRWGLDIARLDRGKWVSRLLTEYRQVTHWMPLPSAPREDS